MHRLVNSHARRQDSKMTDTSERSDARAADIARQTVRSENASARLQVIAAVLGVAAGILAIFVVVLNSNVQSQGDEIAKLRQQVSDQGTQLRVANTTIREVQDENLTLKRALPAVVDLDDIPSLQKAEMVVLTSDYELDLESVLPKFDLKPADYFSNGLTYDAGVLSFKPEVGWARLAQGKSASYEACAAVTDWRQDRELNATLFESGEVCLQLESGRIATVVAKNPKSDEITLEIAVYELP